MQHGLPRARHFHMKRWIYVLSSERGQATYLLCAPAASVKWEGNVKIVFTVKWEYTCQACRQRLEISAVITVVGTS